MVRPCRVGLWGVCLSLNHRQDDGSDDAGGDAGGDDVKDDEEEGCDDRCWCWCWGWWWWWLQQTGWGHTAGLGNIIVSTRRPGRGRTQYHHKLHSTEPERAQKQTVCISLQCKIDVVNSVKGKIITRNIYLCIFVSVLYVCCQGGGLPAAEADSGPGCWQGGKQGVGPHHAAGCVCACVCVCVCVRWWGIFAHIVG